MLVVVGALMSLASCEWLDRLLGAPPTAVLVGDPTSGDAPLRVTFDLSDSTAPGGLHRYRLDFGDGTGLETGTALDDAVIHTYDAAGTYTAALEITDDHGRTDHATEAIVVGEAAGSGQAGPIAVLGADATLGDAPLIVSFDVSLSSAPGGSLISYRLDFGDGTQPAIGTNFSQPIIHLYAEIGLHTATLYVTDAHGATGTATLDVVATTVGGGDAPVAKLDWQPHDPFINEEVTFDAGDSTDPSRVPVEPQAIVVYTWDFGDGAEAATTAETVDHTYTWPGTYTVTLTVYDDDGVAGTATEEIDVRGAIAYVTHPWSGKVSEIRFPGRDTSRAINASAETVWDAVISPDGAFVYVSGFRIVGATPTLRLAKYRAADLALVTEANLAVEAFSLAIHPDGDALYATSGSGLGNEVLVIDTATLGVIDTIPVQSGSNVVAFAPNGDFAYVPCANGKAIVEIDAAADTVVQTVFHPEEPRCVAIHPSGDYAYVTTYSDHVLMLDLAPLEFTGTSINVGGDPAAVAFTHDGARAYVVNTGDGTVSVIDTSTHAVTKTIALDDPLIDPPEPVDIAISPGDTVAVVPHAAHNFDEALYVSVIDLATNTVLDQLSVGLGPLFVDVWGIGY